METELHNFHVVLDQPGYSPHTTCCTSIVSEQPGYLPHTPPSTSLAVSEIPGYSPHTPPSTSLIAVLEIPGYSPHAGTNEVLEQNDDNDDAAYEDIDNDDYTSTARGEEGEPGGYDQMTAPQLPARAVTGIFSLKTTRGAAVAIASYVVAALVVFAVCAAAITHIYTTFKKGPDVPVVLFGTTSTTATTFETPPTTLALSTSSMYTSVLSADSVLTSAVYSRDLIIGKINITGEGVTALSVSNTGQLLVGQSGDKQLHVYSSEGIYVRSINVPYGDTLVDAVWTPHNNSIVCSTKKETLVVVMSATGDVIAQYSKTIDPGAFSVSPDKVIYLTDGLFGEVSESKDDGVTWRSVVKVGYGQSCEHAIRVRKNNSTINYVWLVKSFGNLRIYTINNTRSPNEQLWRHVTLPNVMLAFTSSKLVFDGYSRIFMTDMYKKGVHVWSVNGSYVRQLVSSQHISNAPVNLAVDWRRHVMYVGQERGVVSVFALVYQ